MALHVLCGIKDEDNELQGFRIYDTDSNKFKDLSGKSVLNAVKNGVEVQGLKEELGLLINYYGETLNLNNFVERPRLKSIVDGRIPKIYTAIQESNEGFIVVDCRGKKKLVSRVNVLHGTSKMYFNNLRINEKNIVYSVGQLIKKDIPELRANEKLVSKLALVGNKDIQLDYNNNIIKILDTTKEQITTLNNCRKIDDKAASGNHKIKEIYLSESTVVLGDYTFSSSTIKRIIPSEQIKKIGLACFHSSAIEEFNISKKMTDIPEASFYNCIELNKIKIPGNIKKIGDNAFGNCTGLKEVIIEDGVTEIGSRVFKGCKSLKTIIIPKSVSKIGSRAFSDCVNLSNVILEEGLKDIDSGAFSYCTSLHEITLPKGIRLNKHFIDIFKGCDIRLYLKGGNLADKEMKVNVKLSSYADIVIKTHIKLKSIK